MPSVRFRSACRSLKSCRQGCLGGAELREPLGIGQLAPLEFLGVFRLDHLPP